MEDTFLSILRSVVELGVVLWNPDGEALVLQLLAQPVLLAHAAPLEGDLALGGESDVVVEELTHQHQHQGVLAIRNKIMKLPRLVEVAITFRTGASDFSIGRTLVHKR